MNYKDKRWKKKRENILRRDNYLCRECKRYGKTTPATTVHHIKMAEDNPELRYDSNNLISVCNACHNTYHDRESNELTDAGLRLLERTWKEL